MPVLPEVPALFLSLISRRPARSTLFPYTTLFRSRPRRRRSRRAWRACRRRARRPRRPRTRAMLDRKSTRLNSSHTVISYAVFCFKQKIFTEALGDVRIDLVLVEDAGLLVLLQHGS